MSATAIECKADNPRYAIETCAKELVETEALERSGYKLVWRGIDDPLGEELWQFGDDAPVSRDEALIANAAHSAA